ncbi:MAG TPA: hypothetical protein VLG49_07035 [Rhabdochlamydiaceae bacterium]|nr:hypothetical protein [Rhabdochlamydiaceae bacterium]
MRHSVLLIGSFCLLYGFNHQIQNVIFKDFSISQKNLILLGGCVYIFTAIGTIGYKALYALQKGYRIYVLQAIGGILSSLIALMFQKCVRLLKRMESFSMRKT